MLVAAASVVHQDAFRYSIECGGCAIATPLRAQLTETVTHLKQKKIVLYNSKNLPKELSGT